LYYQGAKRGKRKKLKISILEKQKAGFKIGFTFGFRVSERGRGLPM